MDPGRIYEYDLSLFRSINRLYPVSCGLGLIGCNGDLLPDQTIHKCRLSYVRPSDQGGKSGFILVTHLFLISMPAALLMAYLFYLQLPQQFLLCPFPVFPASFSALYFFCAFLKA